MKYMPAIIPVAVLLIVYGAASFVNWSANPSTWGGGARAMTVYFGLLLSFCVTGIYMNNRKSPF